MVKRTSGLSRDLIIHPGETLQDILQNREMTQKELAIRTGVTEKHVSNIVNCLSPISTSFAKKLEYALGIDTSFWLNLQSIYEKELLEFEELHDIKDDEIAILKNLKDIVSYLQSIGILEKGLHADSKIIELRRIFNISSLVNIPRLSTVAAFRGSPKHPVDEYVLFAWQKICDLKINNITLENKVNITKLITLIPKIKEAMFIDTLKVQTELEEIFASCGIIFTIVQNFKGAPVHGLIKYNDAGNIVLAMTIRGAYADIFWFTLFHEIAHIINNDIKEKLVDYIFEDDDVELRANEIAKNILLDPQDYAKFVANKDFSLSEISKFARSQNVPNYILIGRLQKEGLLSYSDYPSEKLRYRWS